MNRAQRRAAGRVQHRLIPWPSHRRMPINLVLSDAQKAWTCVCRAGWLSITTDDPSAAFELHVAEQRGLVRDG